jgi:protein involved in polysaccharide export with SLBB domain
MSDQASTNGRLACLGAVLLCALAASCSAHDSRYGPLRRSAVTQVAGEPYRIKPGDELEIRFFHTPELDVAMPVRPDGYVSLPLVHELMASGRTVEELRQELVQRYAAELADPEVAVIVRTFGAYLVHVGGEVARPGEFELRGEQHVLEGVMAAGGFLPTAKLSEVVVARRRDQGGFELVHADLEAFLEGRRGDGNVALRPYDVVYVPRTAIAEVNLWVDQYLRKNIPLSFSYRLDNNE